MEPDGGTVYVPDNKGTVHAIELASGKILWKQGTGTIGRPSLVWAVLDRTGRGGGSRATPGQRPPPAAAPP